MRFSTPTTSRLGSITWMNACIQWERPFAGTGRIGSSLLSEPYISWSQSRESHTNAIARAGPEWQVCVGLILCLFSGINLPGSTYRGRESTAPTMKGINRDLNLCPALMVIRCHLIYSQWWLVWLMGGRRSVGAGTPRTRPPNREVVSTRRMVSLRPNRWHRYLVVEFLLNVGVRANSYVNKPVLRHVVNTRLIKPNACAITSFSVTVFGRIDVQTFRLIPTLHLLWI